MYCQLIWRKTTFFLKQYRFCNHPPNYVFPQQGPSAPVGSALSASTHDDYSTLVSPGQANNNHVGGKSPVPAEAVETESAQQTESPGTKHNCESCEILKSLTRVNEDLVRQVAKLDEEKAKVNRHLAGEEELRRKFQAFHVNNSTILAGLASDFFRYRDRIWVWLRVRGGSGTKASGIGTIIPNPIIDTQISHDRRTLAVGASWRNGPPFDKRTDIKRFHFDHVFDWSEQNNQVNFRLYPLIQQFLQGSNVCIIADGYSGTGKSYTMFTQRDSVACAAVDAIFQIQRSQRVAFSAVQVENNTAKAFNFTQSELDMDGIIKAEEPVGGDASYKGRVQYIAESSKALKKLIGLMSSKRTKGKTDFNLESSRSQLVCTIIVQIMGGPASHLYLVDLAGNERAQNHESKDINLARIAMWQVLLAYQERKTPIPVNRSTAGCNRP